MISKSVIKSLLITGLMAVVVTCYSVAQDMGRPPEPPNGNSQSSNRGTRPMFDRSRMEEWSFTRATSQLTMTANESKVIAPKIKKIISLRSQAMEEIRPYQEKLQTALEAKPVNDKAVKQNLDLLISKGKEIKKKSEAAEEDLKAVLSVRQEAQLMISGIITEGIGGMGMGMMGFMRGNPGGRRQMPRGQ